MNRYQKLLAHSLAAIVSLLIIFVVSIKPSPIMFDVIKVVWTSLMVSLVYFLLYLSVDDFRKQD